MVVLYLMHNSDIYRKPEDQIFHTSDMHRSYISLMRGRLLNPLLKCPPSASPISRIYRIPPFVWRYLWQEYNTSRGLAANSNYTGTVHVDDSVSRFWDKYIAKTVACNVSDASRRWYLKHVETFIKAHSDRRLADIKAADDTKHPEEIGRKPDMPDWNYYTTP